MKQVCPSCREETLFVTEAVYDGFHKTGETRRCSLCGYVHVLPETEGRKASGSRSAARGNAFWEAFAKEHTPSDPDLFDVGQETARLCRKCAHYVVNPFTQRCMLHDRVVEATDSCDQFDAK